MCRSVTWAFCYVNFDSVSLGWDLRFFISKKLPIDANLLILLHGSHFQQQNSVRELPCGNPGYFKLTGNKVKRASFFQLFFFLSQVHLDHILPISVAHCCGESVLSLPVLKSERSLNCAQRVASNFFWKIFSAWFLRYSFEKFCWLPRCIHSPHQPFTPAEKLA